MITVTPTFFQGGAQPLERRGAPVRKNRRWLWTLGLLVAILGFVLLLSALVETPAADTQAAQDSRPITNAMLQPAVPPSSETASPQQAAQESYLPVALLTYMALSLALPVSGRDANGRVLRRRCYVRSFHPVFKQDLACG